ncbi:MAG: hypothetical protein IBJ11_02730 [Phycisphaerales bacterium]|nr:hypothetical protein [Phycisphaerales bacterium]
MARKRAIIEVSPARIELAIVRGSDVLQAVSDHHDTADWNANWPAALAQLSAKLRQWVAETASAGLPASVVYTGAEARAGVFACPAGAGRQAAERAAQLALTDAAGFSVEANPHAFSCLQAPQRGAAADAAQIHTLGFTDRESSVASIFQWLSAAGLRPDGAIPVEAALIRAAARAAAESTADGGKTILLMFGEQTSVLAAADAGRLRFVRTAGFGAELLAEALTRPMQARAPAPGADPPSVTLARAEARELLYRVGIPERTAVVDEARGLLASSVLPLLQPVLQRLVLEIKQSVRFGVAEDERAAYRLRIAGYGAAIPRLATVLGELCGFSADTATAAGGPQPTSAASGGVAAVLGAGEGFAGLRPRSMDSAAESRKIQAALWSGVAAAMALTAGHALITRSSLGTEQQTAAQIVARAGKEDPAAKLNAQLIAERAGVTAALTRIDQKLGQSADFAALLRLFSEQTPEEIILSEVVLVDQTSGAEATLRGQARPSGSAPAAAVLRSYLDRLSGMPIVASVQMGGAQRVVINGAEFQDFQVSLRLVELPRSQGDAAPVSTQAVAPTEPAR